MQLTKQSKDTIFVIVLITCVLLSPLVLGLINYFTPYFITKLADRLFASLGLYDFGNSLFDTLGIADSVRQEMIRIVAGIAGLYLLFRRLYKEAKKNDQPDQPVLSKTGKIIISILLIIFVLFIAFIILSAKYNT